MTDLSLGRVLGGYRLDEVAGRGGMGVVYRATQVRLDRVVALKVIAPELASDTAFRERFQREARLLASVDDPHVVPVYEADEADGQLFLSMRWIDGGDMADEIARTGGLEATRAQHLLAQVAGGLDAVHAHGLVHGDLKPANMLIEQRTAARERAYLSDFGAGRSLEATASGNWLGTVDYVAPETIRGAPPDARSDRYGLACVLFEALTGAPPFHRDTAWATMWAHFSDPVPSVCERRPALPRAVDAVLARGLAKDPDQRYATAERMLEALSDALVAGRGEVTGPLVGSAGGPGAATGPESSPSAAAPAGPSAPELSASAAAPAGPSAPESSPSAAAPAGPSAPESAEAAMAAKGRRRRRQLVAVAGGLVVVCAIAGGAIALASRSSPHHPPARTPAPATISRTQLGAGTVSIRVAGSLDTAYVLDQFGPAVDVVQEFGGAPVRIPLPSKPRSIALDSAHKLIWVGLADDRLVAIRLSDHQVLGNVALPLDPDRLAVLPHEVVAQQGNPVRLVRVDSTRLRVIGPVVTPPGAPTSASTLISYNGTVLSTLEFPVRLEQFNASLQRVADHPIGVALPTEMAVDSNGVLWVTDYDAARVWRLDLSSGTPLAPALPVGQDPTWMAVSGGYVWVASAGDDTLNVINEQFNTVTNASMPIGSSAGPLAPADTTGNAWMASGTQLLQLQPNS